MRTEADLNEWKQLYEVAVKLKDMKPWEELWDMDLIAILLKGTDEPCICSVMGRGGEYYGIGTYIGIKAINDFFLIAESREVPAHQLIRYQNGIICNFGDRDDLTQKELKIIKELGLNFRGRNNWIYFRTHEKEYAPYMPNRQEVVELTEILKNLYMAIKSMRTGTQVDFESGKMLMRRFDEESGMWVNYEIPPIIPQIKYVPPSLEDEVLLKRLKNQPVENAVLEIDIVYLNSIIKDKNYDKPVNVRMCILADEIRGMLLSQNAVMPVDSEVNVIFETAINYVVQRGRPKKIVVRDEYYYSILEKLCEQLSIKLIKSSVLHTIDDFVESFCEYKF